MCQKCGALKENVFILEQVIHVELWGIRDSNVATNTQHDSNKYGQLSSVNVTNDIGEAIRNEARSCYIFL